MSNPVSNSYLDGPGMPEIQGCLTWKRYLVLTTLLVLDGAAIELGAVGNKGDTSGSQGRIPPIPRAANCNPRIEGHRMLSLICHYSLDPFSIMQSTVFHTSTDLHAQSLA